MIMRWAFWFGVVLLVVGTLGFIPTFTPDGRLFGVFAVDALHNVVHVVTGVVAIGVGMRSVSASISFFQVFGVVYGLMTLLGLFYGNNELLGIMAHNWADVWLHVLISGVALYLGFGRPAHHPLPAARA